MKPSWLAGAVLADSYADCLVSPFHLAEKPHDFKTFYETLNQPNRICSCFSLHNLLFKFIHITFILDIDNEPQIAN